MFSYASQVNNLATGLGLILPSMRSYKSCISAEVAVKLVLILFALICEFRHDGYDFLLQHGLVALVMKGVEFEIFNAVYLAAEARTFLKPGRTRWA